MSTEEVASRVIDGKYEGFKADEGQTSTKALPLPANAKASDLVAGKVYSTSRGDATWDGTKFTLVK